MTKIEFTKIVKFYIITPGAGVLRAGARLYSKHPLCFSFIVYTKAWIRQMKY